MADPKQAKPASTLHNARKLLNKPEYFVTPVIPIVASLRSGLTESSNPTVIDAYNLFVTRIKDVATILSGNPQPPQRWPALEYLQAHTHALSDCINRDLDFVLPHARYASQAQQDLSIEDRSRDFRTVSSTCHHALQLLSSLFAFPALLKLFSDIDLAAMLDRLVGLLEAESIDPSSKKTRSLAVWSLTMQHLPGCVLLPSASRIIAILEKIIKDRKTEKMLLGDSFKVLHNLLVEYPSEFLYAIHDLFPHVLQKFHSSDRVLRLRAGYAVAGFARAISANPSDASDPNGKFDTARRYLSDTVHRFAVQNHTPPTPAQGTVYKLSFWKRIRTALPSTAEDPLGEDAAWAFSVLGSLVVLLDGHVFTTTEILRPILEILSKVSAHPSAYLANLRAFLWRCLYWSFTRIHSLRDRVRPSKDPNLTAHESLRAKYYSVLRNGTGVGVRSALVYALLGPDEQHASAASPERSRLNKDLKNALHLVRELVVDPDKAAYEEGISLLARMTAGIGNPSVVASQTPWDPSHILDLSLLGGSLLEIPPSLVESSFRLFDVNLIRPLSDAEVSAHWSEIYSTWNKALKQALNQGEAFPTGVLDTWRTLLLSKAVLTPSYARLDAPPDFTRTILQEINSCLGWSPPAGSQLAGAENTAKLQVFRLRVALSLWRAVSLVYSPTWLHEQSLAVLNYAVTADKDLANPEVKAVWENLCTFIVLHGEPKLLLYSEPHLASIDINLRRSIWTKVAAAWQFVDRPNYSWQDVCTFMTIPPRLWEMDSPAELEAWSWLLDHAILTAGKTLVSADVVLETLALDLLVNSQFSHTLFPKIFSLFIPYLSLSDSRKIPATVLEEIGDSLLSYDRNEVDRVLKTFAFFTERVRSCPPSCLVPFLGPLSNGLAIWIRDLDRVIPDKHHDEIVINFYIAVVDRLTSVRSSAESLAALQELLGAPIVDEFRSPRAGLAFQRFCEHVCASHAFPSAILPPSLQRRLGAWYDALDIKDRPSFIGADPQSQAWSQSVDKSTQQVVPDSQPPEDVVIDSSVLFEQPLVLPETFGHISCRAPATFIETAQARETATIPKQPDRSSGESEIFFGFRKRRRSDDSLDEERIFKKPNGPHSNQDLDEDMTASATGAKIIAGVEPATHQTVPHSFHRNSLDARPVVPDSQVPNSQPVEDSLEVPDSQI